MSLSCSYVSLRSYLVNPMTAQPGPWGGATEFQHDSQDVIIFLFIVHRDQVTPCNFCSCVPACLQAKSSVCSTAAIWTLALIESLFEPKHCIILLQNYKMRHLEDVWALPLHQRRRVACWNTVYSSTQFCTSSCIVHHTVSEGSDSLEKTQEQIP